MTATWLSTLLDNLTPSSRRDRKRVRQRAPIRPRLEALEDRLVPAVRTWDGLTNAFLSTGNSNWNNAQNWVGDVAPVAGDDLVFPVFAFRKVGQVNNFAAGTSFNSIRYDGGGYLVTGNRINLGAGGMTAGSGNTFGLDITLDATRTFTVDPLGATMTLTGAISGAGGITKQGAGLLELAGTAANTAAGAVSVQNGTLQLNKPAGVNAINGALSIGVNRALDPAAAAVVLLNDNQIPNAVSVSVNRPGTLDLAGRAETVGPLNIDGGLVKTGAGLLTLNADITATSLDNAARIEGTLSIGSAVSRLFTVSDGPLTTDLLITAAMSGAAGAGMTKEGAGRMELVGANTGYSGATAVNAGALRIDNALALGPASAPLGTTVSSGATLEMAVPGFDTVPESLTLNGTGIGGAGALQFVNGVTRLTGSVTLASTATIRTDRQAEIDGVVSGSGALTKTGTALLTLDAANPAFTGAILVSEGTLRAGDAQALGSVVAGTTVASGAALETTFVGSTAEPLTLAGAGLTLLPGGALRALNGIATFTAPITLTADTTVLGFEDPDGGGGGRLNLAGSISGPFDLTLGISEAGGTVEFSGATANTYGDTVVNGLLHLNKSPGVNAIPAGSTLTIASGVAGGVVFVDSPNQIPDTVPITGSLSVAAAETIGPLTLNDHDTLSSVGGAAVLGGNVTVNGFGTFSGNVSLGNAPRTITVNAAGQLRINFGSTLSGGASANLTKEGPGDFIVLGTLTHGGTTTVNGGRLSISGGLSNAVTVNAGGLLAAGTGPFGTITGAGGTLTPGFELANPATGILEVTSNLTMNATSVVRFDIAGTIPGSNQDQIHVTGAGTVDLGNAKLDIRILPGFQSAVGNRYTLIQNDTANPIVGKFTDQNGQVLNNGDPYFLTTAAGTVRFLITYDDGDGNEVVLTHVNTASALQDRAVTSPVVQGGVATLTGTIVEPDAGDGFFLDINWGDGTPVESFRFPPDAPRDVALTHPYSVSPGTYSIQLAWHDDQGEGNNATLDVTVIAAAPTPTPTPRGGITAALFRKKVGASRKLFVRVLGAGGQLKREIASPFQKPAFQVITATAVDTNGDGITDAVQLLGRKGKKVFKRTVSV
jgi:autotransporter-associated beta strand protein